MGSNEQQDGFMVIDEGDLKKYRTEIPNLIDDLDMSVYAFRLYVHLKRVAGEGGKSFQGTRTLAEHCHMSMGSISKAKTELVDLDLIAIEKGDPKTNTPDLIRIKNIWPQNFMHFSKPPGGAPVQDTNDPVHDVNTPVRQMNTPVHQANDPVHDVNERKNPSKKEPYKKEPSKKGEGASAPPAQPPKQVVRSRQPARTQLHHHSPYLKADDFVNGYIPEGAGQNPVQVYYERFSINSAEERLRDMQEDDLVRSCPDLDKLREVIVAYSRTPYRRKRLDLIIDWYNGRGSYIPRKDNTHANRWQRGAGRPEPDEAYHVSDEEAERLREFFRQRKEREEAERTAAEAARAQQRQQPPAPTPKRELGPEERARAAELAARFGLTQRAAEFADAAH